MTSVTVTSLETSSRQKGAVFEYKVYSGSNGNLLPMDMFKNYFQKQ